MTGRPTRRGDIAIWTAIACLWVGALWMASRIGDDLQPVSRPIRSAEQ